MLSYWLWLCFYVIIPILAMLAWRQGTILRRWKTVLIGGIGSLCVAVPWDYFAIRDGLWWFPKQEIISVWFLSLPFEEWLFISLVGMEITMMALIFMEARHV